MNAAPGRRQAAAWAASSFVLIAALAAIVVARAWVADDAYISYRVIDNFVHGHGLRWNVVDRVQVFTHPLWVLLQIPVYAVVRSPGVTMLLVATSCVAASIAMLRRQVAPTPGAFLVLIAAPLLVHQRLLDFLWSGLETPLLLALLVAVGTRSTAAVAGCQRSVAIVTAAAAGIAITRPDATLIALPVVAAVFVVRPSVRRFVLMLAAGSPALIWSAFAWLYFGSPFPNTALAKLGAPWPQADRWRAGLTYLQDGVLTDPVLVVAGTAAAAVVWRAVRRRDAVAPALLAAGGWMHAVWVVRSGGDFMSGRFLLPAYIAWWVAAAVAAREVSWDRRRVMAIVAVGGVLVAIGQATAPSIPEPRSDAFWAYAEAHPIDERRFYQACFSVLHPAHTGDARTSGAEVLGLDFVLDRAEPTDDGQRRVTTAFAVGWLGYEQGPSLHIVDAYGLVDPVIARAELDPDKPLRPGHLQRLLPDGYLEYLLSGDVSGMDPSFAAWALPQRYVVEAPVFDRERLRLLASGLPSNDENTE